jgi:hypothetical protein
VAMLAHGTVTGVVGRGEARSPPGGPAGCTGTPAETRLGDRFGGFLIGRMVR